MVVRLSAPARRRQLLDTALDIFAERGFHDTSMNDVAEAAGVTKPVLYQHFSSKRGLYQELLHHVGDQLLELLAAAGGAGSPHQQVETGFAAFFRFVDEHPSAYRMLFWTGNRLDAGFAETIERVEAAIAGAVTELIAADLDGQQRRTIAHGVVGLAEVVSRNWVADGRRTPPDQVARQVADLAWYGLRGIHRI